MAHRGLSDVRRRIADACVGAGVPPEDVTLVAVSKNRSDDEVRAVHAEGQLLFAENRAQALAARRAGALPDDIAWHFIGPLQSRKIPIVAQHAAMLQSLDRSKLARIWAERAPATPVLVEFNLGGEPQKSGFAPTEADRIVDELLAMGLDVRGVMAIPPRVGTPGEARPWFAMLRSIYDRYRDRYQRIDVCSMGMTDDFAVAIAEGATMVRVGRAIFD